MKKVLLSTIAAAALTTTAMAEIKVGVGIDLMLGYANPAGTATGGTSFGQTLGSTPVIRIDIDGLVPGLRIEPRFAYITSTNPDASALGSDATDSDLVVFGLAGFYDLSKLLSVGAYYDMYTLNYENTNAGWEGDASGSSLGVVLKAEAEIAKGFTIASEIGMASTTTTYTMNGTSASDQEDLHPVTSVTLRYFF